MSEGERAAMSWACEMTALLHVGERLTWIDFEGFLTQSEAGLQFAFAKLGFDVPASEVATIVGGPLMQRYSKGPEHAYTAELRRQVLDQARRNHAGEIARAMAWLEKAGKSHPLIAQALAL